MPHSPGHLQRIRECIGISFESNEELYLVVRKHWIILVKITFLMIILALIDIGLLFIGNFAHIPVLFTVITMFGITMFGLQYIFVQWINQELDLVIVTNRRIISYDQVKFLGRKMSQTTIDLVQEVNAATSGLLGNVLHYGELIIKTASDSGSINNSDFHMTQIPEPIEVSRQIHEFIDENRHKTDNVPQTHSTPE